MAPLPAPAHRRLLALALAALLGAATLAGCSPSAGARPQAAASSQGNWPRTFTNADGSTTQIPAPPERVLSTAVSVTGTLLAIDAPVVASGASTGGEFFDQWASVAKQRNIEPLWEVGSFDPEAVMATDPDLIVVATSGRDSLADKADALRKIAPTIVVDYGSQTWQDLAGQLGQATGREKQADAAVASFDQLVAQTAQLITVPDGAANILAFHGPGEDNPVARATGAHSQLLASLGFTIEDPDPAWHTQTNNRGDFVWAPYEKLTELKGTTTFVLSADDEAARTFAADPVMANVPSVQAKQVYGLGPNSFRMDPYSAREIVEHVRATFGAQPPQA